jgi:hypothetical protein
MQKKLLTIFLFIFILGSGSLIFLFQETLNRQTHVTSITTSIFQRHTNETPISFNLTGVFLKDGSFVLINNVTRVEVSLNTTQAKPGDKVELNVTFIGYFGWGGDPFLQNLTQWYIERTINIHYFGVEFANETSHLLVPNNGPWDKMVAQIGEQQQVIYLSPINYLRIRWIITPTQNVIGKTLKICGGYFATYKNITGKWDYYNELAYRQAFVINSTVISIPSVNCELLKVLEN